MAEIQYMQPTFAGGEFDPQAWGRVDVQKYATGLRKAENFLIHKFGSISNRPGFLYLDAAKNAGNTCRLVPFVFSDDQAFFLEFGVGYIRFWNSDGSQVKSAGTAYEVAAPYTESQLNQLRFVQSADTIYISCFGVRPKKLVRYASNDWTFSDYAFKKGPFLTGNLDTTLKITPSGKTGSITLTASADVFESGHVGSLWRMDQNVSGQTSKDTFSAVGQTASLGCGANCTWRFVTYGTSWLGRIIVERSYDNGATWLQLRSYTSAASTANQNVYANETEQCLVRARVTELTSGSVTIDFSVDPYVNQGQLTITAVTDSKHATATVDSDMPLGSTDATDMWYEAAWSDVQGWPAAVTFWEDRVMFAGTKGSPRGIWLSKPADYYNFGTSSPTSEDSDSINENLTSRKMSVIHTLVPMRQAVLALSEDGVNTVSYSGSSLTPTSISQRAESYYGAKNMAPVTIGSQVIYVQETGGGVRAIGYDYVSDSYNGDEISLYAANLVNTSEIIDAAYQPDPDSTVWMVRADGVLLGLTYLPEEKAQVVAWTHHTTDGEFESVCCIPYQNATRLFAVVKRTINGQTVRYIERLSKRLPTTDPADQLYTDAAYTYSGTAVSSVSVPHLAGKTVKILADGSVLPNATVAADGTLPLAHSASKVAVGLGYTATLQTLNIEMQGVTKGTMQGLPIKIGKVILRLLDSRGGKVGQDLSHLEEWQRRLSTDYLGDAMALYTGDADVNAGFEYEEGGRLYVVQDEPLPITILALIIGLEVSQ